MEKCILSSAGMRAGVMGESGSGLWAGCCRWWAGGYEELVMVDEDTGREVDVFGDCGDSSRMGIMLLKPPRFTLSLMSIQQQQSER